MLEDLIGAVGERHGFRASDYTVMWDGGQFDAARDVHELAIKSIGGTLAMATLSPLALSNPWTSLWQIEEAFRSLARQVHTTESA